MCTEDNKQTLIGFLYGELNADECGRFEAHLASCEPCRAELAGLRAVRDDLLAWAPRECRDLPSSWAQTPAPPAAWRGWLPAMGLAAAATIVLAVSAAIANFEIRYDADGLVVRTGRREAPARAAAVPAAAALQRVTATDLAELETRLRRSFSEPDTRASVQTVALSSDNPQLTREVRRLIEESERRTRQEMAAKILDIYSEWDSNRRADLLRVQQVLGQVQSRTGAELAQTRDAIGRLMLVSQAPQR